jgi:hypothetical protein
MFDISISIEIRWAHRETTIGTDTGVVVMQNALTSPLRDTVYVHSIDAQGQETVTRIMHEQSTVEKLADPTIWTARFLLRPRLLLSTLSKDYKTFVVELSPSWGCSVSLPQVPNRTAKDSPREVATTQHLPTVSGQEQRREL